jgi:2-dehydro-3-deoxygalactonokinase
MKAPRLVAVDWGTTRLRAYLVDVQGDVLARSEADEGIIAVRQGNFGATLRRQIGPWLESHGNLPVVMAGMVGSRNGWVEAPYVACPTDIAGIAARVVQVDLGEGISGLIVPGLTARDCAGVPDVMRGEETKLAGCGVVDGTVICPGTHAKWARLEGGSIRSFATYMTGEIYGALSDHTILGKLADEPTDEAGFAHGLEASARPGGLTHQAFSARTLVLMGDMPRAQVLPFISGLLIGYEVKSGLSLCAASCEIVVISEGALARGYGQALAARNCTCRFLSPETAFNRGLLRILEAS